MKQARLVGEIIGGYHIDGLLGEGGMGAVYSATHRLLQRRAAVKVLLPQFSHDPNLVKRFFNEARAATAIDHAGIVQIFDYGQHTDGSAYIVMELLQGESLERRLTGQGRLTALDAIRITRQAASALAAAHTCGIVHRDLKPDNIFLVPDSELEGGERVKILDFGIAKLMGAEDDPSAVKTHAGSVLGTPTYMAPEQCSGAGNIDHRVDIYALGCVLYHLVCGRPPFLGTGTGNILIAHMQKAVPPPMALEPSIPPELEPLMLRALAKSPAERFATMDQFAAELDSVYRARVTGVHLAPGAAPGPRGPYITSNGTRAQSRATSGRGRRWLLALAFAGVIGAALVGVMAMRGGLATSPDQRELGHTSAIGDRPGTEAARRDQPASAQLPAQSPPVTEQESATQKIVIAIESRPPGARVIRVSDGVVVGETPYEVKVAPTAQDLRFTVEKQGFRTAEVQFPGRAGGREQVALQPVPRRDRKTRKRRDRTRPRPDSAARSSDDDDLGYR